MARRNISLLPTVSGHDEQCGLRILMVRRIKDVRDS